MHADIHKMLGDNVKRSLEIVFWKNEIYVFDFRLIEKS